MIKPQSLVARLLLICLPLVTITLLALFSILEYQYYQNKRSELLATITDLTTVQGPAISAAVWEYDQDEIENRLITIGALDYVSFVSVHDQRGLLIAEFGDTSGNSEDTSFTVTQELLYEHTNSSETLGHLKVVGHPGLIREEMLAHAQVQFITLILLIIVLSGGTFYATRTVISRPLETLKSAMKASASEAGYTPVEWSRRDEIGRLVGAYNEMQELRASAENELVQYQNQLETLVEQRTAEVEHKSELLEAVLGSINQGLVAYDEELMLIVSNSRFREIRDIPESLTLPGSAFVDWVKFDADRGEFGEGDPEHLAHQQVLRAKEFVSHTFERTRPDGTIIEVEGGPLPNGGFVSTFTDITARKTAQRNLANAYQIISDSITYASRIQRSVLPDGSLFNSLLSDHFVLWEPRDVVGGDMYWSRQWGEGFLIVLGDCTGHGVPGAFMTLIATGALDIALSKTESGDVATLMQRMHKLVQFTLGQHTSEGESDDGLDLTMCFLDAQMSNLTFVGAQLGIMIVEGDDIMRIKGTKCGIGYRGIPQDQYYEAHFVTNLSNKSFYVTTDGLTDQIGGERHRMFGKKRLKQLLQDIQDMPMSNQRDKIREALIDYQGDEGRRDDVAMIGFKV